VTVRLRGGGGVVYCKIRVGEETKRNLNHETGGQDSKCNVGGREVVIKGRGPKS